ncbi:diacylglycerol kinase family lipid kinase [Pediococcus inopinatus]|uniref:Diacylglycerol kinase family lipid kinase n=1 Tax=Pediococcus inopinatus TaxID=114090 RepID=A0ABZ0Q6E5_9LACO|nr:diacylglycerol kinase family protein [Pediococcus inopinatus]WPC20033.1 diacylglycerol kinase family lipid kinase [Pediococcus inopinatus]WPC21735.1 diacylglycerol kinase family lipid kinase [Pediococcus inopinatus]WPP09336.1 diacylglycerol kinase family lipid kinase [Pediococcus inopinatus]
MTEKRPNFLMIVNPFADAGQAKKIWQKIEVQLKEAKVNYRVEMTDHPGNGVQLAREFALHHKLGENWVVVAVGGDGTLHEVLNGLHLGGGDQIPLGYLPAGSGDDFARGVRLPTQPLAAVQKFLEVQHTTELDVGVYKDRIDAHETLFTNNVGVGFDASVVHAANAGQKDNLKKYHMQSNAYVASLIKTFFKQDAFGLTVKTDETERKFQHAFLVTTTNIKYFGGGVPIVPLADLHDGKLDLVVVEKMNAVRFVKLFVQMLATGNHLKSPVVHHFQTKQLHIETDMPENGQVNGENIQKQKFDLDFWVTQRPFWI